MKQKLSIVTALAIIAAFIWVCTSSAIPPMPTYTGTGVANITTTNLTATTANITTLIGMTVESVASFAWDGGGAAVTAGTMRCKVVKDPMTLTGWTLDAANASNTIIGLYIGNPNADGTHVSADATGGANITTGGANASYIATRSLTGWGTNVTIGANTEICANALSTTATWVGLTIHGKTR